MSFRGIGQELNRSERWAALAVAAAERREKAQGLDMELDSDGSIVPLRRFTSSELLDVGFNIGMVAQRQGHGLRSLPGTTLNLALRRTARPPTTSDELSTELPKTKYGAVPPHL